MRCLPAHIARPIPRSYPAEIRARPKPRHSRQSDARTGSTSARAARPQPETARDAAVPESSPPADAAPANSETPSAAAAPLRPRYSRIPGSAPCPKKRSPPALCLQSQEAPEPAYRTLSSPPPALVPHWRQCPQAWWHPPMFVPEKDARGSAPFAAAREISGNSARSGLRCAHSPPQSGPRSHAPVAESSARTQSPQSPPSRDATPSDKDESQTQSPSENKTHSLHQNVYAPAPALCPWS